MDQDHGRSAIKDPKRVDLDDSSELAQWCGLLGASEADVVAAVRTVGPMSASVALWLHACRRRSS